MTIKTACTEGAPHPKGHSGPHHGPSAAPRIYTCSEGPKANPGKLERPSGLPKIKGAN